MISCPASSVPKAKKVGRESNYVLYLAAAILGTYDIDNDH